ncbi:MAG: cobalt transporter CbiM [Synergistaceae bacterium]|jgi:cobalt/nickel transport system permease protein|nr:cobalt transporter CbiM [Synergistaceae bacterium]
MHISEGFLTPQMLAAGWAVAGVGAVVGLKKMDPDKIVRVAVFSSVFFLASLINVRVGPGSTHLSLLAPMGLVLGWSVFPAVLVALLLQAVLLQFGGILVLGANTVNMALPGLVVHLLFSGAILRSGDIAAAAFSFAAGFLAVILGALGVGFFLNLSDPGMTGAVKVLFVAHVPLALIEGAVTLFMVGFLRKTAPDILTGVEKRKIQETLINTER